MPLALIALVWGGATVLGGAGVYLAGEGVDKAGTAANKLAVAGLAAGAGYLYLKKRGVI